MLFTFGIFGCSEKSQEKILTRAVSKQNIVQKVTIAGRIRPNKTISVVAPYEGYLKKVFVKLGQKIKKGQSLITVSESLDDIGQLYPFKAPFSGVVVQLNKKEGESVKKSGNDQQILRIDDLSNLYIFANAPEIDYLKIKKDQEVVIRATAISDRSYKGVVQEIFLAAKESERGWGKGAVEYPVKIEVLDEDDKIKPGMSVIVDVVAQKKENVLALPHEYVFIEKGKNFVTLENGERKEVKTGLKDEFFVEVFDLKEGEKIQQVNFYQEVKK